MRLNKLELNNFGIYYGINELDFSIDNKEKNIILIGGENGAGKSTLLEAIKLNLYGSLAYGVKTNTDNYLSNVHNLFNYNALNNDENNMYVQLDVDILRNNNYDNYIIRRHWIINSLKENLTVKKNGVELLEKDIIELENFIRTVFPPALFDFFLFDGESMDDFIYERDFKEKLKQSAKIIFNLSLLENLKKDLNNYLYQKREEHTLSTKDEQYAEIKEKVDRQKVLLKNKLEKCSETKIQLEKMERDRKEIQRKFESFGGVHDDKLSEMREKISFLEAKKAEHRAYINDFKENILPFSFIKSLIKEIKQQLDKENSYNTFINFRDKLSKEIFATLTKEISNSNYKVVKENDQFDYSQELILNLIKNVEDSFRPNFDTDEFTQIHLLSPIDERKLVKKMSQLNFNPDEIEKRLSAINNINKEIKQLRESIIINQENFDLKKMLEDIKNYTKEIEAIRNELNNIEDNIKIEKIRLQNYNKEYEKIVKELTQVKKKNNIPLICDKIERVINRYLDTIINKKIIILQKKFLDVINKLFTDEGYISDIKINPETFDFKLYSKSGNQLNKLSSGEQELVILSLLWSMAKLSKRRLPLIFDTLLGRIDAKHRKNIIEHLLAGHDYQSIVLSTDSEVDNELYKQLEPFIHKNYLIDKSAKLEHRSEIKLNSFF